MKTCDSCLLADLRFFSSKNYSRNHIYVDCKNRLEDPIVLRPSYSSPHIDRRLSQLSASHAIGAACLKSEAGFLSQLQQPIKGNKADAIQHLHCISGCDVLVELVFCMSHKVSHRQGSCELELGSKCIHQEMVAT